MLVTKSEGLQKTRKGTDREKNILLRSPFVARLKGVLAGIYAGEYLMFHKQLDFR